MKKLRVGHIGWLANDEGPDCTTVAWCDVREDKLKNAKEKHPDIEMYTDYNEMLAKANLDWAPKVGIDEGLDRFVQWFNNERLRQPAGEERDR